MDDVTLALLGDRAAQERLTAEGVLLPCPGCGGENCIPWFRYEACWYECDDCGWKGPSEYSQEFARAEWNTRAPILTPEQIEALERLEASK